MRNPLTLILTKHPKNNSDNHPQASELRIMQHNTHTTIQIPKLNVIYALRISCVNLYHTHAPNPQNPNRKKRPTLLIPNIEYVSTTPTAKIPQSNPTARLISIIPIRIVLTLSIVYPFSRFSLLDSKTHILA